jgi:hypothetical protein
MDLKQFLIELSESQEKIDQFRENPGAVAKAAGLSEEDQQVLRTGDVQKIRAAIGAHEKAFIFIIAPRW